MSFNTPPHSVPPPQKIVRQSNNQNDRDVRLSDVRLSPLYAQVHYDDKNYGVTFLFALNLDHELDGGSHVISDIDYDVAVVVGDNSAVGTVFIGDYRRVLHGNAATLKGRRFILTAYCSASLVEKVAKQVAPKKKRL
jgi:hypothetical protein